MITSSMEKKGPSHSEIVISGASVFISILQLSESTLTEWKNFVGVAAFVCCIGEDRLVGAVVVVCVIVVDAVVVVTDVVFID